MKISTVKFKQVSNCTLLIITVAYAGPQPNPTGLQTESDNFSLAPMHIVIRPPANIFTSCLRHAGFRRLSHPQPSPPLVIRILFPLCHYI